MNACEFTAAITALANALASHLTAEETALLASVLMQLGDTLTTIAAQQSIFEKNARLRS